MFKRKLLYSSIFLLLSLSAAGEARAQGTAFTFQGRLTESGNPANGAYDMQFKLFDTETGGTQHGPLLVLDQVQVVNGVFSVQLDFGSSVFDGSPRFLEIGLRLVQPAILILSPRQAITATPYAILCASASTANVATNANLLGGFSAGGFIQNTTTQQLATSFNISGNGTAGGTLSGNVVNAATQYNVAGLKMLSVSGAFNGLIDGEATILAASNTFVGENAGINTTPSPMINTVPGRFNSMFGAEAGKANTDGGLNSFFGALAGTANTAGFSNSFFGVYAGRSNIAASGNSFFGYNVGPENTDGSSNSFFGSSAGLRNQTGNINSFFGNSSGSFNTTGSGNSFFGRWTGISNTTGNNNTVIGNSADVGASNLTNATAIGYLAQVDQSNSLVLGSINGVNGATASVKVGIGTAAPTAKLTVRGTGDFNSAEAARFDLFNTAANIGYLQHVTDAGLWQIATTTSATRMVITSTGNIGIGTITPADRLQVAGDIRVGTGALGCVKDADGTIISGICSSDVRFKRQIRSFPNTLDQLIMLRPVHFYWNAEQFPERGFGNQLSFGLIAQEVEQVLPELVTEDEQGYKAVRYNKLPLLLLQAIKELKDENDALRKRLEALERKKGKKNP